MSIRPPTPTVPNAIRSAINDYIHRHETAWELCMAVLAVAFVVVGIVQDSAEEPQASRLEIIDYALTALFAAEFLGRLWASFDRRRYLSAHWIDAIALVPAVRGIRLLRLLRLLRLVRTFASLFRVLSGFERMARHRNLALLFLAWGAVMLVCSAGLYFAESGVNDQMQSPADALWWGVVTLTTVGYGDVYPKTAEGRIAAGVLMVLGITLFAGITATLTSFLLAPPRPDEVAAPPSLEEEQIVQLIRLREAGVLSDEEWQTAVARVAERL